jgi:transcriptional regulator with XRE-family HTH domain
MHMTLQDVGERAGVRMQQVQKYEAGVNKVSAVMLWKLSRALGVPPGYFFDGLSPELLAERGRPAPAAAAFQSAA